VDTVRFYERRGLVPADRTRAGYRAFPPWTAERITFIKKMQALGFSLDETTAILRAFDRGETDYAAGQRRLEALLARIDGEIVALKGVRVDVARVLEAFRAGHCEELEATRKRIRSRGETRRKTR
jgi:DNA-binding transcriptional MerR regulator